MDMFVVIVVDLYVIEGKGSTDFAGSIHLEMYIKISLIVVR